MESVERVRLAIAARGRHAFEVALILLCNLFHLLPDKIETFRLERQLSLSYNQRLRLAGTTRRSGAIFCSSRRIGIVLSAIRACASSSLDT